MKYIDEELIRKKIRLEHIARLYEDAIIAKQNNDLVSAKVFINVAKMLEEE